MPPTLHPRSAATTALFGGTLIATFVVVGLPHVFPCPRPRRVYADSERQINDDGRPGLAQKRIRRDSMIEADMAGEAALFRQLEAEARVLDREARECPIPKPKSVIRQLLGWQDPGQVKLRVEGKVVDSIKVDSQLKP